jgi:hypothetical protein
MSVLRFSIDKVSLQNHSCVAGHEKEGLVFVGFEKWLKMTWDLRNG